MPIKDPQTGKPLSGAALARRKKAKVAAQRVRKPAKTSVSFDDVGDPPLDDTAALITWGAKCLAVVMRKAQQDAGAFDADRDQWRFLADCSAKLGMIRDKASEQAKLQRAAAAAGKTQSTKPQGAQSLAQVAKPPTAR